MIEGLDNGGQAIMQTKWWKMNMRKNQFKKNIEKKPKSTQINSTNLWPKIWDQYTPQKEKRKNSWSSRPNNLMSKDEIKRN